MNGLSFVCQVLIFYYTIQNTNGHANCYKDPTQSGLYAPILHEFRQQVDVKHGASSNGKKRRSVSSQMGSIFTNLQIETSSLSRIEQYAVGLVYRMMLMIYSSPSHATISNVYIRGDPSTSVGNLIGTANLNTKVR